jgi:hypothetical protein
MERVQRQLELRQLPIVRESDAGLPIPHLSRPIFGEPPTPEQVPNLTSQQLDNMTDIDTKINWDSPQSWLYSAFDSLASNSSRLAWTRDGWSFVPVDLSGAVSRSNASVHISKFP